MNISFTKMQALGNDFVVIDATQNPFPLSPTNIQKMADRHLGIGFDQLLVLEPARAAQTDFYYRIFNADGSEVGQCGNGARCMALYIKEKGLSSHDEIILQTSEMSMPCRVISKNRVSAQLGEPRFAPEAIPYVATEPPSSDVPISVVNVGNPHAVIIVDDMDAVDLAELGDTLNGDKRFPKGVNVSVMQIRNPSRVDLRVFERGVGETQACGSAACAAMAVGYQQDLLDQRVIVSQTGGDLEIAWQGPDSAIEMTGEAHFVFYGEYPV